MQPSHVRSPGRADRVKVREPTPVTGPRIGVYSVLPLCMGGPGIGLKLAVRDPADGAVLHDGAVLDAEQPLSSTSRHATRRATNQPPGLSTRVFTYRVL
jgi:hypothetical protein